MLREDFTERIVSLQDTQRNARQLGQRIAAALSRKFVRCRVQPMYLTESEVRSICHEWGRLDALAGEPLRCTDFPKRYAAAYRAGYRAGQELVRKGATA